MEAQGYEQPVETPPTTQVNTAARLERSATAEAAAAGGSDMPDESEDHGHVAQTPSYSRVLLYAGLVGLACGVVGSLGASYFFSSHQEAKAASNQEKGSKGAPSSSTRKGAGPESSRQSSEVAESGERDAHRAGTGDVDGLRKKLDDLSKRVDHLRERLDVLAMPRDQIPPDIRRLQNKVGDLGRALDRMGDLPVQFRHVEDRLDGLSEQLKALRSHAPTQQQGNVGRSATPTPGASTAADKAS